MQHFIQAIEVLSAAAIIVTELELAQPRQQAGPCCIPFTLDLPKKSVCTERQSPAIASHLLSNRISFPAGRQDGGCRRHAALYPHQPLHMQPYDAETSLPTPARPQASSVQTATQCIPTVSPLACERCSNHAGLISRWRARSAIPDV